MDLKKKLVKIKGGRGSDPFSIAFRHFFTKKINYILMFWEIWFFFGVKPQPEKTVGDQHLLLLKPSIGVKYEG